MAEGETVFTFKANTRPAEQETDSFFNSMGGKITALNQSLELVSKAISAVGTAITKAVDFAKAGEEIAAIGTRFEAIAGQAGLIPQNISAGIEKAVKGTVDMEDALKAASNALVSLEVGGEKIPQMFELAKKSAALFGGEVTDRFEQISMAVSTGSTRMLRSIGLVVDADSVYKNYAKTLGLTADQLTQAERQQAMMNAILEKGNERFKNVDSSITPIAEGIKRLTVSFGEIGDTAKIVFNEIFGGLIQERINQAIGYLDRFNIKLKEVFLGQAPSAADSLKLLNHELQQQQDLLRAEIELQATSGVLNREHYLAQIQSNIDKTKEQIVIQQQLMNIEATKQAQQGMGVQVTNAQADAANRLTLEEKKQNEERIKGMAAAVKASIDAQKQIAAQAQMFGSTVKNAFVNVISQSMQILIGNLVQGKAAFADFGKVVLGLLGQMAIQIGTVLLSTGIGMLSLKFLDPTGAIVAGLGLIALGSILSAIGSAGGAPAATAGGANAPGASPANPLYTSPMSEQTPEAERMAPQTGVQVVVQGNVFDSRETGLRIAEIINDSFDLNGTIVRATV